MTQLRPTPALEATAGSPPGPEGRARSGRARAFVVGPLVVLFAILVPLSITLGWVKTTILSTDGWVKAVGPIPSEPAVADALAAQLTAQLFSQIQVQQQVAAALPAKASFLAGPIASQVENSVQQGVSRVIQSNQFETLWTQANRFAHAQIVAILNGNTKVVSTTGGQVVLNMVPLLNSALGQVQGVVSGLVGKEVTFPTISGNEAPAAACAKLGDSLGVSLPSNCAQIPLVSAAKLTRAQELVRNGRHIVTGLFVATPLVGVAALAVSRRRRRTLLQLLVGGALGIVIFRRVVIWLQNTLVDTGRPANKAAREAIVGHLLHNFFLLSGICLAGVAVAAAAASVTGPYAWARRVRRVSGRIGQGAVGAVDAVVSGSAKSGEASWIYRNVTLLRVVGVIVAVILLLAFPVSFVGALIVLAVLAVYEFGLYRLRLLRTPAPTLPANPAG
jgi:hypothetical protein